MCGCNGKLAKKSTSNNKKMQTFKKLWEISKITKKK